MKWWLLGVFIFLLLPFYVFILSKCATMGKMEAIKSLRKGLFKEGKKDGEKEKEEYFQG